MSIKSNEVVCMATDMGVVLTPSEVEDVVSDVNDCYCESCAGTAREAIKNTVDSRTVEVTISGKYTIWEDATVTIPASKLDHLKRVVSNASGFNDIDNALRTTFDNPNIEWQLLYDTQSMINRSPYDNKTVEMVVNGDTISNQLNYNLDGRK